MSQDIFKEYEKNLFEFPLKAKEALEIAEKRVNVFFVDNLVVELKKVEKLKKSISQEMIVITVLEEQKKLKEEKYNFIKSVCDECYLNISSYDNDTKLDYIDKNQDELYFRMNQFGNDFTFTNYQERLITSLSNKILTQFLTDENSLLNQMEFVVLKEWVKVIVEKHVVEHVKKLGNCAVEELNKSFYFSFQKIEREIIDLLSDDKPKEMIKVSKTSSLKKSSPIYRFK